MPFQPPSGADPLQNAFASVGLSASRSVLPTVPPGMEALRGKKVMLVDDSEDVLRAFIPPLIAATEGRALFLRPHGEDAAALAGAITARAPDVVLMDGELSGELQGFEVVRELQAARPQVRCIGFSSAEGLRETFLAAGAVGFVEKHAGDPWGSLREAAGYVRKEY